MMLEDGLMIGLTHELKFYIARDFFFCQKLNDEYTAHNSLTLSWRQEDFEYTENCQNEMSKNS